MADVHESDTDLILSSDVDAKGGGDIIFKTGQVERARISAAGVGSGWPALNGGSTPALTAKQLLLLDQVRQSVYNEIFVADGVAAVMLCHDDGPEVDYTTIYPYLRDKQVVGSFAIIQGSVTGGTNLTWAQIKEMHDHGMEIVCHSRTHGSAPANFAAFVDEAITAADDLALTDGTWQATIDGFVQPGTWNAGPYYFNDPTLVDGTDAGDQLRSRYAVATAYVSDGVARNLNQIPNLRRIGPTRGSDLSTITLAQLKTKVSEARGQGALLACGTHAARLGIDNSVATWKTLIDFLAAERDAGRVEFYTLSAAYHLRHSALGRRNLIQDGSFATDAAANIRGWLNVAGAATVNAGDAPSGGNSITIHSASDNVQMQLPAKNYRTLRFRFKAKNDAAGGGAVARLILRAYDQTFVTLYNSLDLQSGNAGTPGPWPAVTDAWQTYECLFRLDGRAQGLQIWPYYVSGGAVRYADFEVYKT